MKSLTRSGFIAMLCFCILSGQGQVPVLNSYPSSSAVIYLDFDGHYVSGTTWNVSGPFTCNPAGISNAAITEVFNRVAEDYRPFNLNITTSEAVFNAATFNKKMRVVITTSYEWYSSGVGGVAYINSFTWGNNSPAFVFSSLLNFNTKNIAEAVSHEAGHTLGLRHQSSYNASCGKISDYNWGQGAGEIGWAPIMGAGYAQNMTLWHNGPNSIGCNNIQSDLSIITNTTNGFGFRPDDHSENFSSATPALFSSNMFNINGVIEQTDDKDVFSFSLPTFSRFQLNAIPYNVGTGNAGSDLDLQVELLDGGQNVIGVYNPGYLLNSIVDSFMNAGNYYLRIDGKGNMYAPEYGSLGSYSLQGTFTDATVLPIRRLELKGQLNRDEHILTWNIDANETVIGQALEVSADGRIFNALAHPAGTDRNYRYTPKENQALRYRLRATFDNNREYYSNVITIRSGLLEKPQLIGNMVSGSEITVSSPGNYKYEIYDQGGRIVNRGFISNGFSSLQIGHSARGMYIIRFSNETEQWTEKFLSK